MSETAILSWMSKELRDFHAEMSMEIMLISNAETRRALLEILDRFGGTMMGGVNTFLSTEDASG